MVKNRDSEITVESLELGIIHFLLQNVADNIYLHYFFLSGNNLQSHQCNGCTMGKYRQTFA